MPSGSAPRSESLDRLAAAAAAGDATALSRFLSDLRERFLVLAKRRVREDAVEDVVQEALRIVLERYRRRRTGVPVLVWSLAVLRNVIGNHYQGRQRERQRTREVEDWQRLPVPDAAPDPLEETAAAELWEALGRALDRLAATSRRCAELFRHLLASLREGGSGQEVTARVLERMRRSEPRLTRNAFYVALHRCRGRLRALLEQEQGGNREHEHA